MTDHPAAEGKKPKTSTNQNDPDFDCKSPANELLLKSSSVESSAAAIATCDLQGKMTYGNPFFQRLWGLEAPEDFLGKSFTDFWVIDDIYDHVMTVLEKKGLWAGECRARKKDGSLFDVQVSSAMVFDADGRPMAMTSTSIDITEKKQVGARTLYLQKIESLGRMAGAVAHQYNNLLAVIIGNLELSIEKLSENPAHWDTLRTLSAAMQASHRASSLGRMLLDYLDHTAIQCKPTDLSAVCRRFFFKFQAGLPKNTQLHLTLPDTGPMVKADENQLCQAMEHLITNALEASDSGPAELSLRLKTLPHKDIPWIHRYPMDFIPGEMDYACLEVEDMGPGIPEENIDKLFDLFYSTKFSGRGLGLPLVLSAIKAHEGCITLKSDPDQGTLFRVFLPVITGGMKSAEMISGSRKVAEEKEKGLVLIVEDDSAVRKMGAMMLTHLGYSVVEANDGIEAVELFNAYGGKIQFVISDIAMPRMNGWETISALRRIEPHIPVILMSGYDQSSIIPGERTDRPEVFLLKPFFLHELEEALRKISERS